MLAMFGFVLSFYFYCVKNFLYVFFEMRFYFVVNNSNLYVVCLYNILWFIVRVVGSENCFWILEMYLIL